VSSGNIFLRVKIVIPEIVIIVKNNNMAILEALYAT
jgi:hypothetical protein